jgi:hypothetical protein
VPFALRTHPAYELGRDQVAKGSHGRRHRVSRAVDRGEVPRDDALAVADDLEAQVGSHGQHSDRVPGAATFDSSQLLSQPCPDRRPRTRAADTADIATPTMGAPGDVYRGGRPFSTALWTAVAPPCICSPSRTASSLGLVPLPELPATAVASAAERLAQLAERVGVRPGVLARSSLTSAIDAADPSPAHIMAIQMGSLARTNVRCEAWTTPAPTIQPVERTLNLRRLWAVCLDRLDKRLVITPDGGQIAGDMAIVAKVSPCDARRSVAT